MAVFSPHAHILNLTSATWKLGLCLLNLSASPLAPNLFPNGAHNVPDLGLHISTKALGACLRSLQWCRGGERKLTNGVCTPAKPIKCDS